MDDLIVIRRCLDLQKKLLSDNICKVYFFFIFVNSINGHMFSCRTEFALKEIMSSGGAEDDIPQGERKTVTDFCYLLDKSKQLFNGLRSVDSWCLKLLSSSVSFFPHGWCVVSFWKLWIKCYINICSRNDHVFNGGCFFLKWKNNRRRVYLILFYSNWVSCFLRWFCVHYSTSYLFYIWFYTL